MKPLEIPGHVAFAVGHGGLSKIIVIAKGGTAEIYLHGAHITSFKQSGEPPLLFLSGKSWFAPDKAIRGGIPICFPWFGPRDGDVAHGFARVALWELVQTAATPEGVVTLQLRLPEIPARPDWKGLQTTFTITVSDTLTMELTATNHSAGTLEIENCLHTYFHVGDISAVTVRGLKGSKYLDKTDKNVEKPETHDALPIVAETNRIYHDTPGALEIVDANYRRTIRVEKSGSKDTVVWNPWTTQVMSDLDPSEHKQMLCVEAGNVGRNKIPLAPGQTAALKVTLSSRPQ